VREMSHCERQIAYPPMEYHSDVSALDTNLGRDTTATINFVTLILKAVNKTVNALY